jgi:hypothetical protein
MGDRLSLNVSGYLSTASMILGWSLSREPRESVDWFCLFSLRGIRGKMSLIPQNLLTCEISPVKSI